MRGWYLPLQMRRLGSVHSKPPQPWVDSRVLSALLVASGRAWQLTER